MDKLTALKSLSALSQETRLDIVRLLIKAGDMGMLSGEMSSALNVRTNTLSANLTILLNAGLLRNERGGRTVRYFVNFDKIGALLSFLLEDCCGGKRETCRPFIEELTCC